VESLLFIAAGLLLLSILFTKVSERLGVPFLLVFLLVGIFAGPEGFAHLTIANHDVVTLIGTIALINILFAGGFETEWRTLKPVLTRGLLLATVGLGIAAFLMAIATHFLFAFSWKEGLLFGSIISCTDVAAVFSVLRSRKLALSGGLGPMAELESASNDPMAVFLALALIQLIKIPGSSVWNLVPEFFLQMGLGAACGLALGLIIPRIINWLSLDQEGLYPPLTIALAILIYAIANALHGNGYLAAYVAGIAMNRQAFFHKRSLKRFHSGVSWLLMIVMFVTLGLILRPSHLIAVLPKGIVISAFLLFFARPLSVIATLVFTKTSFKEMLMVSWLGLRGAVPVILATFVLYSGVQTADIIFNLVFFVVLLSLLVQGTTITAVAKWLKVAIKPGSKGAMQDSSYSLATDNSTLTELVVPAQSKIVGASIMALKLPSDSLIMLIHRDDTTIVPTGRTIIQPNDVLVLLADENGLSQMRSKMQ
jgi:cell volume regulation protein A